MAALTLGRECFIDFGPYASPSLGWEEDADLYFLPSHSQAPLWQSHSAQWRIVEFAFKEVRQISYYWLHEPDDDARHFGIPINKAFERARQAYPTISVDQKVMAGAPCLSGTRIPVYMILDAVEHYGDLALTLKAYPRLTIQHIKDAIGFAKLVVECPIDDETAPTPR